MNFLNTFPSFFWLFTLVPLAIFLLNRRKKKIVKFSSIKFLLNLKTNEINRIKLINIILLIIRTIITILILLIILRPYLNDTALSSNFSDKKIHNYILIDDSFYNKYGYYKDNLRSIYIDSTIGKILDQYPNNSRVTISSTNKGLIYDGFNKNKIIYLDLDNQIYNYKNNDIFLKQESSNVNNLHLISNLNKNFINYTLDSISSKFENFYNIYYYNLPSIDSNLYISNIKLINKDYNNYKFSYQVGNINFIDKDLNLTIYKNDYSYKSKLELNQKVPMYSNKITVNKNKIYSDTLDLNFSRDFLSEIVFKIENIDKTNIDDNIYQDNHFSFINNRLRNIITTVVFNNENEKNHISKILNSFKVITKEVDSSFFKVHYVNESQFNKYKEEIINSQIFIFLGYNLFSSINSNLDDYFQDKNTHFLIFPSIDDMKQNEFDISLTDSLKININRIKNNDTNYDTLFYNKEEFKYLNNFKNDKIKLRNYFIHDYTKNTNFSTKLNNSLWSTFNEENLQIDLFGFMINNGNNFFDNESLISVPFMYNVMMNQKLNFDKNNLKVNMQTKISNDVHKYKFTDIFNDSIIFASNKTPLFNTTNTKLLFMNDSIVDLYSFNPPNMGSNEFYEKTFITENISLNIINISDFINDSKNILSSLSINEITKYLILFLFFLIFAEMILSNVKTSLRKN